MATQLDGTNYLTKGFGCGNTTGLWSYAGKLFYPAVRRIDLDTIYVQVWVYAGGSWSSYTGPQILTPVGVGNAYVVSNVAADVYGSTMFLAYQGEADPTLAKPHVVAFDMAGLTFGTPITDYPNSVGYGSYNSTHTFTGGTPFTGDLPLWNGILASSATEFTLFTHGTLGGVQHLNIVEGIYDGASWTEFRVGRNTTESDLLVAMLLNGSDRHIWFVTSTGGLYHQILGGSPTLITSALKVVSGTGVDGRVDLTGVAVGNPTAVGSTVYIPYKNSSGALILATYSGGSWSTATVDNTIGVYSHHFASAQRETDCGNIAAVYQVGGALEVMWWDDTNNLDSYDGSPAQVTQTLWRSRYVSGSWTAAVGVESATAWQRDIDVAVDGSTVHVVYQRFVTDRLTPYHAFFSTSGDISVPSIASSVEFGAFSGITGGVPSGSGCGSGPGLPSSAGRILPRCSTYSAL